MVKQPHVLWPHTGIQAPHSFNVTDYTDTPTDDGAAYSARLVHPELGIVGTIVNEGFGGPALFLPSDSARFSYDHLEDFVHHVLLDGNPLGTGLSAVETLLDAVIDETLTAQAVTAAHANHHLAIRGFTPYSEHTPWGPHRELPITVRQITARRSVRTHLVDELTADPRHRLDDPGAFWQMFNGQGWVPLLGPAALPPEQVDARFAVVEQLAPRALAAHRSRVLLGARTLHVAWSHGETWLIGDAGSIPDLTAWCQCEQRPTASFEVWNSRLLQARGLIHRDAACRRLVRID